MRADLGDLIPLLVFIGVALLSALLNRRKKQPEDYSDLPQFPRPDETARPRRTARKTWEDELRELLEQAKPTPTAEVPPPVIYTPPSPPPVPARHRREAPAAARHPMPEWEPSGETEENILARFKDASQRLTAAEQLHQRVTSHLEAASEFRGSAPRVTPATSEAAKLVRDPKNLRNAILAQVILGRPRALDEA